MTIPESLRIATLLPEAAMRVRRPADPFIDEDIEENVLDWMENGLWLVRRFATRHENWERENEPYRR
jgi:hypothetical protein